MSKKQKLVERVAKELVKAGVDFSQCKTLKGEPLDSKKRAVAWEAYPDGYCCTFGYLDEILSLLTVKNLTDIIKDGMTFAKGTSFNEVWCTWEKNGFLDSTPAVIMESDRPVLRVRYDLYLRMLSIYGFKLGHSATGVATVGYSWRNWGTLSKICYDWRACGVTFEGASVSVSCLTMMLGEACIAGLRVEPFLAMLSVKPSILDKYLRQVDTALAHAGTGFALDTSPTVRQLKRLLAKKQPEREDSLFTINLVGSGRHVATLSYYDDQVRINWETTTGLKHLVVNLPRWSADWCRINRVLYLQYCWASFTHALIGLAGFWCDDCGFHYEMYRETDGDLVTIEITGDPSIITCSDFSGLEHRIEKEVLRVRKIAG